MDTPYDRDKVVDCMFDPVTSSILAELEDGSKECKVLADIASISEDEVLNRLAYLIEHKFVHKHSDDDDRGCTLTADSEKLGTIVEDGGNFDAAINGLEKMDSYLN